MDFRGILVVFLLASIGFAAAQDEEDHEQDKIYFRINKKKVEITFGRLGKSGKKRDLSKGGFKIGLYKLGQTDGRGKDVGRPLQSFGNQVFSASPFNRSAELQGVKAATIKLMAHLKDHNASISLRIFIFKEEGNLTFGDDSFTVQNGTIKFFIKVKNFPFCDGRRNDSLCKKNEVGEHFEAAIVIKTRKGERGEKESADDKKKREGPPQPNEKRFRLRCVKSKKCVTMYRFGNNDVGVASQAEVDGAFKTMPSGYPKLMEQGENQRFIFKGPRFNSSIVFDPVMDIEEDDDGDDGGDGDKDLASSIHLNFFLFVAVLAALFM